MTIEIVGKELTICQVAPDGHAVRLCLKDVDEQHVGLVLPSHCAYQLMMTLPHLIGIAVSAQGGGEDARLVFPLSDWKIELSAEGHGLILTLSTSDGFQVSFGLEAGTIREMSRQIENSQMRLIKPSSAVH